jgi:hypothetical protein
VSKYLKKGVSDSGPAPRIYGTGDFLNQRKEKGKGACFIIFL